jgi:hypothetical protein
MIDQKPKTKADWTSWKNKPYATGDDKKKQQAEAFELLNSFVRHHGGSITSPPGRFVRFECPRGSALPDELRKLGYNISERGTVTRITSMDYVSPADEKFTRAPSPFAEYSVFEITLSGR